jgi:integrase/recombinase XerD
MTTVTLLIRSNRKYQTVTYSRRASSGKPPQACAPGDVYVIRWYEDRGTKIKYRNVGTDLNEAVRLRLAKEMELSAPQATPEVTSALGLPEAVEQYLTAVAGTRAGKTAKGYRHTLGLFMATCTKPTVKEVTVDDLRNFVIAQRQAGKGDRTIDNRLATICTMLKFFGIEKVTLHQKYTEKKVRAYRPDELKRLFAVASPSEWCLFQFFLGSGLREQEVMNCTWDDIDFVDGVLTVREKDDWQIKDREEREIKLPTHLVAALRERMLTTKGALIFPALKGGRDGHMLRTLKLLAARAGMNPDTFGLHVFRKSFATLQHRNGVDARTLQKMLGHSDLATTLQYLEGETCRSESMREKVDSTFGVYA